MIARPFAAALIAAADCAPAPPPGRVIVIGFRVIRI
jgi:hypothetical protein